MHQMTSECSWTLNSPKDPVYDPICKFKIGIRLDPSLGPRGPNFSPFRSTTSHILDIKLSKIKKIKNAPNDLKINLNIYQSKAPCIH